jgi:ABC-type transport system substrate-binding protein
VHLRQGVTWNDGTPFGPDDVINTLDMLRKNGQGKADQLYALQMARDIKDLVRVDDHTVRIVLNHRNPRWFFTFLTVRFTEGLFILPKHIYAATDPIDLAASPR